MSNEDVTAVPAVEAKPAQTVAEKLTAKRADAAKRAEAAQAEKDAAELERFELEERFEKELGGRKDRAFAIVDVSDLGEGHVVVRLGEDVLFNTYKASKMGVVDTDAFTVPCVVHPSVDAFRTLVKRRPYVAERCAIALGSLYGVKAGVEAGK